MFKWWEAVVLENVMGLTRVLGHIWATLKKHMPEPLGSMGNDVGNALSHQQVPNQ